LDDQIRDARSGLRRMVAGALALACVVVVLGAFTRLVDAGLGCPDWPGCYGFLLVPEQAQDVAAAERMYADDAPFEADKAWAEMVHRYFAGTLGLVVFAILVMALRGGVQVPKKLPVALAVLVVCQAAFGMWTVTLKLWPQVVTAHLLGGFATLALLWLLWLRLGSSTSIGTRLRGHAALGMALLIVQIALGGWLSSNYAALACPDFPTCQSEWWPETDFRQGFDIFQGVGPNYLGGLMDSSARASIHLSHRLGAVVALVVLGLLAWRLYRSDGQAAGRSLGVTLGGVLTLQLGLGIGNVVFALPLWMATTHNGVGAILLLVLVSVNYRAFSDAARSGGGSDVVA
jgi:cytochrome c oxidase assembly protein subunit 15